MRKIELRGIRILKRIFNSSVTTSSAKASWSTNNETLGESHSPVYLNELSEPHVHYDDQRRVGLQLLELERQKAEAIAVTRRHAYT